MSSYALPLPYYASPDGAVQDTVLVPNPAAGVSQDYKPSTGYIEDILNVFCVITTGAAVGNRIPTLALLDPDGNLIWAVNSPTSIPATSSADVQYSKGAPSAYGVVGGVIVTFIPQGYLYPGYTLNIGAGNIVAPDAITGIAIVRSRIPTGSISGGHDQQIMTPTPLFL